MTDAAAEPLIASTREYPHEAQYTDNDAEDVEVDESALVSPGPFIWGLTICSGVSGLLFGYEYVSRCPIQYAPATAVSQLYLLPN